MNPELTRNLLLECTPLRLVAAASLIVLSALAIVGVDAATPWSDKLGWAEDLIWASHIASMALIAFWGARKAADGVAAEMRERTWDQQRLSGLGPWSMTLGKVLGAPSAALSIFVMLQLLQAALLTFTPPPYSGWDFLFFQNIRHGALWIVAVHFASAILVCAAAFFIALTALNGQDRPRAFDATLFQLTAVFGTLALLALINSVRISRPETDPALIAQGLRTTRQWIEWAGVGGLDLIWLSVWLTAFALWALYGAYHQMRRAFALRTSTLPWMAFLGFGAVWAAGMAPSNAYLAAFLLLAIAAYAAALIEPHRLTSYRLWGASLARLSPKALIRGPAWIYAWLGATAAAVATYFYGSLTIPTWVIDQLEISGGPAVAAAAALLLRDMGVAVWAGLRAPDGRGLWTAVVVFGVLHILGPVLAMSAFGLDGLQVFAPLNEVSLISASLQAIVIWALAAARLSRSSRPASA